MSSSLCFGGFFELIIIVVIGFAFSVFCGAVTFAPLVTAFVFWISDVCATDDAAVVVRVVSAGFAAPDPLPSSSPLILMSSLRVKF